MRKRKHDQVSEDEIPHGTDEIMADPLVLHHQRRANVLRIAGHEDATVISIRSCFDSLTKERAIGIYYGPECNCPPSSCGIPGRTDCKPSRNYTEMVPDNVARGQMNGEIYAAITALHIVLDWMDEVKPNFDDICQTVVLRTNRRAVADFMNTSIWDLGGGSTNK